MATKSELGLLSTLCLVVVRTIITYAPIDPAIAVSWSCLEPSRR